MTSSRVFVVAALLVTIALGGGVSYYASPNPDGLERVAIDQGFDTRGTSPDQQESPLAGYGVTGIDHVRLSTAAAGVAGVAGCFLLTYVISSATRRKSQEER